MLETILSNVLTAVIITFITVVGTLISKWLIAVLKSHNVKVSDDTVEFMMNSLTLAITKAVTATNQTYVDNLKKNGQFDAEAQKEAMIRSINYCKSMMASNVLDFFEENYSDMDLLLTALIEAYIGSSKNSKEFEDALNFIMEYMKKASEQQGFTVNDVIRELRKKLNLQKK